MSTTAPRDAAVLLAAPVATLPGVGTKLAERLERLDIRTVRDLLEHEPSRLADPGRVATVDTAGEGQVVTIVGELTRWSVRRMHQRRGGKRGNIRDFAEATILDEPRRARLRVVWFNQGWRARQIPEGSRVAVTGKMEIYKGDANMKSPDIRILAPGEEVRDRHQDHMVATYPATESLPTERITALIDLALGALEAAGPLADPVPGEIVSRMGMVDLSTAFTKLHRPRTKPEFYAARDRLVHDELLYLQLALQGRRHRITVDEVGIVQERVEEGLAVRLLDALPFTPTGAQRHAFDEVGEDLAKPSPMHRLIQGDVGAGKTLVAAWAMLTSVDHGRQAVLMAPTEVLAEQHLRTLDALLAPLGINAPGGPRLELVTRSVPKRKLRGLLAEVAAGEIDLLVGTHALLGDQIIPPDLGLVVIDEQHRFGTEHRTRLRDKRTDGRTPDVLVMTATPIPRSLALTFYGDLDVTVLKELPPGRQPIHTEVIDTDSARRGKLVEYIRSRAQVGERTFWVCPTIDPSEALDLVPAVGRYEQLRAVLSDVGVGLVHGRLPAAERDEVMEAFRRGDIGVLVATTVIEVGVDVPTATTMVIEDAERFGISQLHQLRGRIGRGQVNPDQRNFCVLFTRMLDSERLAAFAGTTDGFALAEADLSMRGEGSLFDTRQSGLADLRLAKLQRDLELVARTRSTAWDLIEADPELADHPQLAAEVARRYGDDRLDALAVG